MPFWHLHLLFDPCKPMTRLCVGGSLTPRRKLSWMARRGTYQMFRASSKSWMVSTRLKERANGQGRQRFDKIHVLSPHRLTQEYLPREKRLKKVTSSTNFQEIQDNLLSSSSCRRRERAGVIPKADRTYLRGRPALIRVRSRTEQD